MNKLKKAAIGFSLMLLCVTGAMAQPPQGGGNQNKGEKVEALLIAWLTQRLNLTPEEAQKFWPVFNSYRAELKTLRQTMKLEEGAEPSADQMLEFDQKKLDLKKKYKTQFEAAIGKAKVDILYRAEEEFKQKLKEMREQRQQNRGQGGPPPAGGNGGGY
ncbi:MAG: hypothetical protein U0T75_11485 [Chitinophagales bacterium]